MFCIKCGNQIPDEAKFCPKCGQAVQGKEEEKLEKKIEKKFSKQGEKSPVWKKIVTVLVAIVVIVAGYFVAIENWKVAEIPNPQDFFGLEASDTSGGFDINWHFESEWDSLPVLEKYADYIERTTDNIWIRRSDSTDGNVSYEFVYDGIWLGNSKPMFRFSYYGNDYYGTDSSNRNYVLQFRAENNFELVESKCYAGDETVEDIINDNAAHNSQKETEKDSQKVETNPLALPDPCLFFGCGRGEDQSYYEEDAHLVSCCFNLDEGREVVYEYLDLLNSGKYPLEFAESYTDDYISVNATLFERYIYNYTGDDSSIGEFTLTDEKGGRTLDGMFISIYYNYRSASIMVTVVYENDFELVDSGMHVSQKVTSYSGSSSDSDDLYTGPEYEKPDFAKLDCVFCDDGDCPECDGYGTVKRYNGDGEYIDSTCPECRGSRNCWHCGGTGKRED